MWQLRLMFVICLFSPYAQAYVDPGSSMLLLQGVFALIGGLIAFVKHPLVTVKRMLSKFRKR